MLIYFKDSWIRPEETTKVEVHHTIRRTALPICLRQSLAVEDGCLP